MKTGEQTEGGRQVSRDILIGLLVIGSVWGFLEVVLGGAMKAGGVPYKGDVLTGLGMMLMGIALAIYRKPLVLLAVAAVAVGVRQLSVPILHLSTFCKANSCLAVLLGGAALAGASAIAGRRLGRGVRPRVGTGFSAGLAAATGFFFIGMHVAPCRYLLSFNRPGGFVAFLQAEGLIWAALSAVLLPVGLRLGEGLRDRVFVLRAARPVPYYLASMMLVVCCWGISAIAIARGF